MAQYPYTKRKDGRYCKQIVLGRDENGKRIIKTLYDTNCKRLDKKVREYLKGGDPETKTAKKYTVEECYNLWFYTKYALAESTKQNYKLSFTRIGNLKYAYINDISSIQIQEIYAKLSKTKNPWVIEGVHIVLKQVFQFAENNGFVNKNIIKNIESPKKVRQKRRGLTPDEKNTVNQSISMLDSWQKAFVMLCLYTGMRRNEILALTKADIDFKNGVIHVNKMVDYTKGGKPYIKHSLKTDAGLRDIPIITNLKECLEGYVPEVCNKPEDFLFTTRNGTLYSNGNFSSKWKTILKKINKFMPDGETTKITPHYFRHNFATELVYAGVDLKVIQYIMGHASLEVTLQIYTDLQMDNKQFIAQADAIFGKDESVKISQNQSS